MLRWVKEGRKSADANDFTTTKRKRLVPGKRHVPSGFVVD